MGKLHWNSLLMVVAIVVMLSGCMKVEATKQEKEIGTLPHKVAQVERDLEKALPVVIDVVDPQTEEIVQSFIPWEMDLDIHDEAFKTELEKWAKELARGTDSTTGYDQKMIQDRIGPDGQIIKGKPMVILDEAELVERVLNATQTGGTVELPIEVKESQYNPEEVANLDEVVVASYTTYFDSGVTGRAKNIEISASAINNVILGVGDHFSFNEVVGPRDQANGYQKAMEIVNKELVEGIGGGVCQTSSTLFNAIDQVGVEYLEWHHHSLSIGYVPAGRDATVSYGGLDFRFKNKKEVPLLIKAYVKGGSLTVEIRTSKANAEKL
ncbi:VanW family protein [Robertmurraya andreesenii]|uniref:Vancomycin resistance protein YoaR n=1 Tax=Anoxybacillus andreesenii TaxID=1325932 RepID=A0ABT9V3I2_9BACL|nr:VanW family protein [Robertmurraya andreesenii]MDQ0155494.1 vancomycin resistance protein YoaR [Robertmurraya andreesenii]